MAGRRQVSELRWVFRPASTRPAHVQALAGAIVHGTAAVGPNGETRVTLADGTDVRATAAEIIAE
jgi:hypothetical protein